MAVEAGHSLLPQVGGRHRGLEPITLLTVVEGAMTRDPTSPGPSPVGAFLFSLSVDDLCRSCTSTLIMLNDLDLISYAGEANGCDELQP
jgi:hypothetical protein